MTVSLGDIIFNTDDLDDDGVLWYCRVDGWDKLDQRTTALSPPAQHGQRTAENLYSARSMTMFGTAVSEDLTGYWAALNHLQATTDVLTVFTDPPLILTMEEEVDKQMAVLRTGLFSKRTDSTVLTFELTLSADDPFKYAAVLKTLNTSGVAVNAGTKRTFPVFTQTGASAALTLTNGANTWSSAPLPVGTVIDFNDLSVTGPLDTNYFGLVVPSSTWFPLATGNNTLSATVAGTWSWRDAWL